MAEDFFGFMKSELLYAEKFESANAFMKAWDEYIEYYDNYRIKSRLKGKSTALYRALSLIASCLTLLIFWGLFTDGAAFLFSGTDPCFQNR